MKQSLLIGLTIAAIVSQITHDYHTFKSFSNLEGAVKEIQAWAFCAILSVAIFTFVLLGETWLALLGAGIEVVINVYYYSVHYWQRGNKFYWRKSWIAIFFGVLIPMMIFVFSEQLIKLSENG